METAIEPLRVGRSYRLTYRGGYQDPQGRSWSAYPAPGFVECRPITETVKIRSTFILITGALVYNVSDKPRSRTDVWAVKHDDLIAVEEVPR